MKSKLIITVAPVLTGIATLLITGCGTSQANQPAQSTAENSAQSAPSESLPPGYSSSERIACQAVHGTYEQQLSGYYQQPDNTWQCSVPVLGDDGQVYQTVVNYSAGQLVPPAAPAQLIPGGYPADETECNSGNYAEAVAEPGPGIWNAQLGLCLPPSITDQVAQP